MEYIDGKPLKKYENTIIYYDILKESLINAYNLDLKGIFHGQLGRYYHILNSAKGVRFIDFERGVFTENPRNFLQIIGYYLYRDEKFDKKQLIEITSLYKSNKKDALNMILKVIDESKY